MADVLIVDMVCIICIYNKSVMYLLYMADVLIHSSIQQINDGNYRLVVLNTYGEYAVKILCEVRRCIV